MINIGSYAIYLFFGRAMVLTGRSIYFLTPKVSERENRGMCFLNRKRLL